MRAAMLLTTLLLGGGGIASAHTGDPHEIQTCELRFLEPPNERGAVVTNLWPDGLIFYDFDAGVSALNRARMRSAMNTMESAASVHFIPRTDESSFLHIGGYGGNWSYAGQIGGSQDLSIYNWNEHYIICHELMHAMGRYHQHSRTDRNTYITVNYGNIDDNCESQYSVYSSVNYLPYDFDSLMHYGQWDCSIGGQTMTCKPGYEEWQNQMGQRTHLSTGDIGTVEIMYPEGQADLRMQYLSLGEDELEPGGETSTFAIVKNMGDGPAIGPLVEVRLSADDEIADDDVLLSSELLSYVYSDDNEYVSGTVTVPAETPDGVWYIGARAVLGGDPDASNDTYVVEVVIGDPQPCSGDVNGDGTVGVDDILQTIGDWGPCGGCGSDVDGDGVVGVDDLLLILSVWGECL
jgi:hypothetical protein